MSRAMTHDKPLTRNLTPFLIRNHLPESLANARLKRLVRYVELPQQVIWERAVVAMSLHLELSGYRPLLLVKPTPREMRVEDWQRCKPEVV